MLGQSGTSPTLHARPVYYRPRKIREDRWKKKACSGQGHTVRCQDLGWAVLAVMFMSKAPSGLATTTARTVMKIRTLTYSTMKAMTLRIWK